MLYPSTQEAGARGLLKAFSQPVYISRPTAKLQNREENDITGLSSQWFQLGGIGLVLFSDQERSKGFVEEYVGGLLCQSPYLPKPA